MSFPKIFRRRQKLAFAEYGCELRDFVLAREGHVEFAQWRHPYDRPTILTQAAVDALRQFISPGDFVIDVGAHTGDTTVPMALAAGAAGCALAVEPNPYVFKVLGKNAALNRKKTHIVPRCCAATERDGKFVFHYSDAAPGCPNSRTSRSTPRATIARSSNRCYRSSANNGPRSAPRSSASSRPANAARFTTCSRAKATDSTATGKVATRWASCLPAAA
jgi:FkbM family methyltransferase